MSAEAGVKDYEEVTAEDVNVQAVAEALGKSADDLRVGGQLPRVSVTASIRRMPGDDDARNYADISHRVTLRYSKSAMWSMLQQSLPGESCESSFHLVGYDAFESRTSDGWPKLNLIGSVRARIYKCIGGTRITPRIRKTVGFATAIVLKPSSESIRLESEPVDIDERLSRIDRALVDTASIISGLANLSFKLALGSGSMLMSTMTGTSTTTVTTDLSKIDWSPSWFEAALDPFTQVIPSSQVAVKDAGIGKSPAACNVVRSMTPDPIGSNLSDTGDEIIVTVQETSRPRDKDYLVYYTNAYVPLWFYVKALSSTSPSQPTEHVVKDGDSLWKVAEEFYGNGKLFHAVASASGVQPDAVLRRGQVLTVPRYMDLIKSALYVRRGESLWSISRAYENSDRVYSALVGLNADPNVVFPAQAAGLPSGAQVRKGSTRPASANCGNASGR